MSTEYRTGTITNPKSCFLDLSYTSGSSPSRIERVITDYFRGRGFEVKTGRMAPGGEPNDRGILQVIKSCSFGIVVYNEFRHNIGYEWGLIDALDMPVIPFRDRNTHIDFDKDFSDKKGINFVHYSGDSDEKEIIEELENSDSLKAALENVEKRIMESISPEETDEVKEASKILTESNIPLGGIATDKKESMVFDTAAVLDVLIGVDELTSVGHFFRANAYYYAGDFENAEKEYREAIRINSNLAEVHYNLGVLLERSNRYEEAAREYRVVIRIKSDYTPAHYNLGNLLSELGSEEEAEKEYREAIRLTPNFVQAHYNLGNLLKKLKRYYEAENEYRKVITINPYHAEAHNNLGNLLKDLKRYGEAEKEYREAIGIKPDLAEAHNNLGNLLKDLQKQYDKAEEEYRKVIKIKPDYAEAHYNLGNLLKDLKRYGEAEKEYRGAIRINSDYAEAHNNLGTLFLETERLVEAEKEFRKTIIINPKYAEAHANLGLLFSKTNRPKEGEKELVKAHELFLDQGREEDADIVFDDLTRLWYID